MFRVFQLIRDTIMSIDLLLFFIACLLQVSLSLYFMTLKLLKAIVFFLTPCLSLNKTFLIWEWLVWLFLHSYIHVRYSQPEYIINDVSFSMSGIWKHTLLSLLGGISFYHLVKMLFSFCTEQLLFFLLQLMTSL